MARNNAQDDQAKTAAPAEERDSLILVSPSGHKYEVRVTDSGNLTVEYKGD